MASLALDDQLCFVLYSATHAVTAAYRDLLDDLGVTYPQYLVLLALWDDEQHDEEQAGSMSVKDISERLHLDSGTLSPLIGRLEKNGLVEKHRSREDSRRVQVRLTEAGRAQRSKAECIPQTMVDRSHTAPEHLAELRTALSRLTENLRAGKF